VRTNVLNRTNELFTEPEWYNSLMKTCTTNIVTEVNRVTPGRVPFTWRAFLSSYAPKVGWNRGIIPDKGGFRSTLEASDISERARNTELGEAASDVFSRGIRGRD